MNLDSVNKWLTLTANVGVLAGIVFLAVEINQNTRAVEIESIWARTNSSEEGQRLFIENSESIEWLIKFSRDPEVFAELLADDDVDAWQARAWARLIHLSYQARFQTLDSSEQREQLLEIMRNTYDRFPFVVTAIKSVGLNVWDEDFRIALTSVIDEYENQ